MAKPVAGPAAAGSWSRRLKLGAALGLAALIASPASAPARIHRHGHAHDRGGSPAGVDTPEIRISAGNPMPACVTPARLMAFLRNRNTALDPRFDRIAEVYRHWGETWRVRWDYAFFQMAIETNFLSYRQGNGHMGDVVPRQNNFAGIGTTGGGVPGDGYPDVSTGVLAQIQHLVAYSGETLKDPVAPRTRLKQDDIVAQSLRLGRPVRFGDLARRWAADRRYGQSIEWVASRFREKFCSGQQAAEAEPLTSEAPGLALAVASFAEAAPAATLATPVLIAPPRLVARVAPGTKLTAAQPEAARAAASPAAACAVVAASYGGTRTLLIRSAGGAPFRYTALSVLEGFERTMASSYISRYEPGGVALDTFASRDEAIARAQALCRGA